MTAGSSCPTQTQHQAGTHLDEVEPLRSSRDVEAAAQIRTKR